MYIPKRVLDPIINRARALFPVNEYGRAGMLSHPGARISAVALEKDTDIMLISNTPRSLRNGRYYPGWSCFESSFYIANQLKRQGATSSLVVLKTPLYDIDVAVLHEDTLISITPGVPSFQELRSSMVSDTIVEPELLWKSIKQYRTSLSPHMILGWQDLGTFSFLTLCGMRILKDDILRTSVSSLYVSDGQILCEGRITADAHFPDLEELKRRSFSQCHETFFGAFKINSWTDPYDVPGAKKAEPFTAGKAEEVSFDIIPKMFRILDTDWFNRQAG